ncbi:NADPH-dependent F420 reductase [Gloeobacter morelensis]|uniref:NAD(P)-binding domain-containing protein n=1 Tax=Gloeobacter morelensis MG652769 TaxID=2781736 RepID=A0ABY3PRA2_9CYAN|nr:NAD(P)-binding domain-containing protein [Gloeobacter morelensis]UFP96236.1 NAD(P)-binding domain-containing protein [Gloeobacter morelensis MG652769]
MQIGIVGAGSVGSALGKLWAATGHRIMFSYSRDPLKLEAVARAAGPNAATGTPREAVEFGEVVVLAVPWGAAADALARMGSLAGKLLCSTVNALKPDFSGLDIGTTTSAAEWIAGRAVGATVVEALPLNAEILHAPSPLFGEVTPSMFYCGDDTKAKAVVAGLMTEAGMEPVDAGALVRARLVEPAGLLVAQLGYGLGVGPNVALKVLRR